MEQSKKCIDFGVSGQFVFLLAKHRDEWLPLNYPFGNKKIFLFNFPPPFIIPSIFKAFM